MRGRAVRLVARRLAHAVNDPEVLIIGAGPAGLTAATYLGRFRRRTMVMDAGAPRACWIPLSHNMPGFPAGITGADILKRMREQAEEYGAVIRPGRVESLVHDGEDFIAQAEGRSIRARAILLATGVVDHHPDLPGVERAVQKALVRICPICDGYEATGKAANSDALNQALNVLEAKAVFDGECHALSLRVAWHNDTIIYDLADEQWRCVTIDATGWTCCTRPFLFWRTGNTHAQVQPISGGTLERVLDFVNLSSDDQRILLLCYLPVCLIPTIPHPIPVLSGGPGSAKSTLTRILRKLVDPANEELLSMPNDPNELALLLSRNYVCAFDNMDGLKDWQSDYLCRAATGGGITKRKLYTDDEEVVLKFRRCVVLNGITPAAVRPDLLDRTIPFHLERIPPSRRKGEADFWSAFDAARPGIVGAMFDVVAKAIEIYPTVRLSKLPRMADFTRWGYAVAEGLSIGGNRFLSAYWRSIQHQNEAAIQNHPVATAVASFMGDKSGWQGTPAELLTALEGVAETEKIDVKERLWPKAAHVLTRRLREVKHNLQDAGITVTLPTEGARGKDRIVAFQKNGKQSDESDESDGTLERQEVTTVASIDATGTNSDATENSDDKATTDNSLNDNVADATDATDAIFPTLLETENDDDDVLRTRAQHQQFMAKLSRLDKIFDDDLPF